MQNNYSLTSKLTPREREVALLVSEGLTNEEIAQRLIIATSTVKTSIEHCFSKTNSKNRTMLGHLVNPKGNSRALNELDYALSNLEELQATGAMGDIRRNGTLTKALAHVKQAK